MKRTIRLALAQINSTVGDLAGNTALILRRIEESRAAGVDLVVFPEMAVTGYPPEDLLLKPDFVRAAMRRVDEIAPATAGLTVIVGSVQADKDLFNAALVYHDGKRAAVYHKRLLPNYGVFDENRYFQAGRENFVLSREGIVIGVSICEDIWYADGPPEEQASRGGAELLINISASPYHMLKGLERQRMLAARAADNGCLVAYCNMVGGQDELVFDGHSMVIGPDGRPIAVAAQFVEELLIADMDLDKVFRWRLSDPRRRKAPGSGETSIPAVTLPALPARASRDAATPRISAPLDVTAEVYHALVLGTRDYVRKNGFRDVVLGLSGGIDSSLTAAVAVEALGAKHVHGVAMPTRYSSAHSFEDAVALAHNLGIRLLELYIDGVFQAFLDVLAPVFEGRSPDVTEENIQPRVRGTLLMALSNKFGWMVLTTGNKSETGVGYSTLYGDTAGGFAMLKDVPKERVYDLSRFVNRTAGREVIPQRVFDKPPSAELRPDQKDSDALPEYGLLDPILAAYVEERLAEDDIVGLGFDRNVVRHVIGLVDRNEYKRRQSPPGIKVTPRAFGKDWRLPITNRFGR